MEQPHKPPSYLCSRIILEYINFPTRTSLAQRCPLLVSLHNVVPIKIRNIVLSQTKVVIDDAKYQLSVLLIPKEGEASRYIKLKNKEGGWKNDIDEYGFEKGEFERGQRERDVWRIRMEAMERELEENLRDSNKMFHEILKNRYEREIGPCRLKLEMYQLKEENRPSPYNQYIQLTIDSKYYKKTEYIKYANCMARAMDSVRPKLLGLSFLKDYTIRVDDITVEKDAANALSSISRKINYKEYPVKSITTFDADYDYYAIFENCGIHIICNSRLKFGSLAGRIRFTNCRTHRFTFSEDLHKFVRSVMVYTPIGKHYSIELTLQNPDSLSLIPNSVKGTILVDGNRITCYTVQSLDQRKEINCYYIEKPNDIPDIHVVVHPSGHATRVLM